MSGKRASVSEAYLPDVSDCLVGRVCDLELHCEKFRPAEGSHGTIVIPTRMARLQRQIHSQSHRHRQRHGHGHRQGDRQRESIPKGWGRPHVCTCCASQAASYGSSSSRRTSGLRRTPARPRSHLAAECRVRRHCSPRGCVPVVLNEQTSARGSGGHTHTYTHARAHTHEHIHARTHTPTCRRRGW